VELAKESEMQSSVCAIVAAVLLLATDAGPRATAAASPADLISWRVYRNEQYAFELRYPPDYTVLQPRNLLEPPPVLRVWFKEAGLVNSPIAEREPPQFAVDVYDNPSRKSLDAWLESSGVSRNLERATREPTEVAGAPGLRLTDRALLAPNTFYFVTRDRLVYRFTPLGALSDQMLATIRFTR
jgi:hypothetical protein